ncbi:UDP-glucosyltransferase 2-like [Periplaneta americana]|uniref:UDP-glucosyltransferase 2-like n=1 Tax=Periplaneta americana TaxID=6978 RepID=UPI0037E960C2
MPRLVLSSTLFFVSLHIATSARILGLFPYGSKSHFIVAGALLKGLASRGHEVYVLSHFPLKNPVANYTDISLVGSTPTTVNSLPVEDVASSTVSANMAGIIKLGIDACENALVFPAVQNLFKSNQKFDLIITEFFNTDCILGFVHKFKVPYIAIGTSVILPWTNSRFGNPDNPSYMPTQFSDSCDRMSFPERLLNTLHEEVLKWVYDFYITRPSQVMARRFFGESLPPLEDLAMNASLLLLNTHFSISKPRPFVPAIVEVAGIHLSEAQKLPQDLQQFLDEADHGVVYFTLGSQVRMDSISAEKRKALLQAFSQLPQRVLWKWEGGEMSDRPNNVKIAKWLPQYAVLCHPAVRVFVTHTGLLGTIEAVDCGVPMVAIPLFGDQAHNAQCLVSAGVAKRLNYHDINNASLLDTLKEVLEVSSYSENAARLQRIFRDRPLTPLDNAIFWTEYVIRNGGATHMRSAALDLSWYEYLLLDVVTMLFLSIMSVVLLLCYLIKALLRILRSTNDNSYVKKIN